MRGGGDPMIEIIYAQHALKGTEPDWGAMGASDIGFAAGMCKQVGEQVKNVIEFPFVVVDGLFIKLPIALVHGLVQLAEDPQGTVEGLVEKIKVLPAYIEQVPAEFKAYIDEISAIEDPYQQGEALGQLMGDALPTGAVVGGVMGKVGKWKITKAGKAAKVEGVAKGGCNKIPVGRRGNPLNVVRGTNVSTIINGRKFTGHALDKMQGRGFTPTIVEEIIKHPTKIISGKQPGTTVYIGEKLKVVLNEAADIITVIPQ